jgi:hypothetical protein
MVAVRRLAVLALPALTAAVLAAPAGAVRPPLAPTYPEAITSAHFQIHYTGDPNAADRATHQQASDTIAQAEKAYSILVGQWGYPAPLADVDGKVDIWITDLPQGVLGITDQDVVGSSPSTSWIGIDPEAIASLEVIAHELTHVIQLTLWNPTDTWLHEGTARWAGLAAAGYLPFGGATLPETLGAPDMSLTCSSPACGNSEEAAGYTRWEFFEYLTARFGKGIVRDIFAQGAVSGSGTQTGADLLVDALAAKGYALGDVYGDYTLAQVAGSYQVEGLKGLAPIPYASLSTGNESKALPVKEVPVNHLATRYLKFNPGGGASSDYCFAATLNLTVTLPAGLGSRPSFFVKGTAAPVVLSSNGTVASASVPWSTCSGGPSGYLALPNPSLASDAQVFTVGSSVVVDPSTIVTPKSPPPGSYSGPTASDAGDLAPAIKVYGAQLVRVSPKNRAVRFIVFSSGGGLLRGALGKTGLGTRSLRAGNNEIRFVIPAKTFKALRSTQAKSASKWLLTLTSLSTTGKKGASVTRRVVVTKATAR